MQLKRNNINMKKIFLMLFMFLSYVIQAKQKKYKVKSIEICRTDAIIMHFIKTLDCETFLGTSYLVRDKKYVKEIMNYVRSMQTSKDDVISKDTRARLTIRYKNSKSVDVVCLGYSEVFLNGVKMICSQELLYLIFKIPS
jgi:hypothetical protein